MSASRIRVSAETGGGSRSLSPDDRGFLLGDGLFETVRLYGDHPFRLEAHLARLREGAGRVGIPVPERIEAEVEAALDGWRGEGRGDAPPGGRERTPARSAGGDAGADGGGESESEPMARRDGALRITLTRGVGSGVLPARQGAPTLVVFVTPHRPDAQVQRKGLRARLRGRVDERALTAGLKATGYLERIVALRAARAEGADEALLVNSRGAVVEGSASNLFVVRGGVLRTPSLAEGALPGITREVVLSLAAGRGLPTRERAPEPAALYEAEEIFLTSSLRELAPVVEVEGRTIGTGAPGPLLRQLHADFRELVRRESAG